METRASKRAAGGGARRASTPGKARPASKRGHYRGPSPRAGRSGKPGDWAIWAIVAAAASEIGIERFGVHDLRRTCAKPCRKAGGDLEQNKFLLGHSSIQTTERYLGSEHDIAMAVNDSLACNITCCDGRSWGEFI